MKLSQRNRNQTATRWTSAGTDIYGNSSWNSTSIKVRWEDTQIKTVDFQGNEFTSNAVIYTGEDIIVGDYLYLGSNVSTTPPTGAYEVKNFRKTPNLKATDFMRRAIV